MEVDSSRDDSNTAPVPDANNDLNDTAEKTTKPKSKSRDTDPGSAKRRCVSTACIACRR
jgi:hypothetical protein